MEHKHQNKLSDDEAIKIAMKENYIWLMIVGGLYISPEMRKNKTKKILWYIFSPILCWFECSHQVMCLIYTCYISMSDLSVFFESFHFVIMLGIMPLLVTNALMHTKDIDHILKILGQGMFDYGNTINSEMSSDIENIIKNCRKIKKIIGTLLYTGYLVGGSIHFFIRPAIEWYMGKWDEIREDGLISQSQLTYWYPFKPFTGWYNTLIFYTNLYLVNFAVVACVIGSDVCFVNLIDEICTQFKVISYTLKKLKKRAEHVYSQKYGKGAPIDDILMTKCYQLCISKSVQHHQSLLILAQHLFDYLFYAMFFVNFSSTVAICLSGLTFSLDDVAFSVKLTFSLLLVLEIGHIYVYCWYGDTLTRLSTELSDSLYFGGWEDCHGKGINLEVCIVGARCLSPTKLSAAGFADISLDTFTNVINSSYTYFNLLQLMKNT